MKLILTLNFMTRIDANTIITNGDIEIDEVNLGIQNKHPLP